MTLPLFCTTSATRGAAIPPRKRGHVAVCPFFLPPHPETLFLLGHRIAAANRDVQVTVFVPVGYGMYLYWYWHPEEDHNLVFYPVGEWETVPPNATPTEQIRVYLEEIGVNFRDSMDRAEKEYGPKITYVVADAFLADVCRGIAEERGVGWSAVWTSSAASMAAYLHGDEIRRKSGVSLPVVAVARPPIINPVVPEVPILPLNGSSPLHQPVDNFLPGFPAGVPLLNLPYGSITSPDDFDTFPFAKMFHDMVRALPKADAVMVDSFPHLESSTSSALLTPKFHLGGPFSLTLPFPPTVEFEDREGIFPWLDSRGVSSPGSVVYINISKLVEEPDEREFHALAEALEATGVPFLWYVAPTWPRVELPEGFLERTAKSGQGKVVSVLTGSWQTVRFMKMERDVLRHKAVGAQLRESTWWSVTESVAAGKAMIVCRPVMANIRRFDESLNSSLVERVWGIGVELEGWAITRSTVETALKRVMVVEEGRKMKEKAAALGKLAMEDANGSSARTLDKFISLVTK